MCVITDDSVLRLRPSVALVASDGRLEMFRTAVRESIKIELGIKNIVDILLRFDGQTPVGSIIGALNLSPGSKKSFFNFLGFLMRNHVLVLYDIAPDRELWNRNGRILALMEEYFTNISEIESAFGRMRRGRVLIAGMGTVGTWVAKSLVMCGVRNFILVDPDIIEESNLHRQELFLEEDIGACKIVASTKRLREIDPSIAVQAISDSVDSNFFKRHNLSFELAINCADSPTVDDTSRFIGKYCMQKNIPHIIGGGYNLHLTLVGQTVLPFHSACVMCFEKELRRTNDWELFRVKKLPRPFRKIGSFGPLCTIGAAITASEAFKILIGAEHALTMLNKRREFDIRKMDFFECEIPRQNDCEWCGEHGIFCGLTGD